LGDERGDDVEDLELGVDGLQVDEQLEEEVDRPVQELHEHLRVEVQILHHYTHTSQN
jgi:uncharacterized protein YgfB (UPF0149 family)